VTGADLADVDELQKLQFIELFSRDKIASGTHIRDLYVIADGYSALRAFFASFGSSPTSKLVGELCRLVKCPESDRGLFSSMVPGEFKCSWDKGTSHTFARWIWHNLLGCPGLLYDELEIATMLGLNLEGLGLLKSRLASCEYRGAFASMARLRWWVSPVRDRIREVAGGTVSDPLGMLGRKLVKGRPEFFSKCHGRPGSDEVPTVVAYSDDTKRKRIQAKIEDTKLLATDSPPFGFEPRRVYSPPE
jgi:hypothetical protein